MTIGVDVSRPRQPFGSVLVAAKTDERLSTTDPRLREAWINCDRRLVVAQRSLQLTRRAQRFGQPQPRVRHVRIASDRGLELLDGLRSAAARFEDGPETEVRLRRIRRPSQDVFEFPLGARRIT